MSERETSHICKWVEPYVGRKSEQDISPNRVKKERLSCQTYELYTSDRKCKEFLQMSSSCLKVAIVCGTVPMWELVTVLCRMYYKTNEPNLLMCPGYAPQIELISALLHKPLGSPCLEVTIDCWDHPAQRSSQTAGVILFRGHHRPLGSPCLEVTCSLQIQL